MISNDAIAVPGPTIMAELPRRASRRQRAVHALSYATLRRFFELSVHVNERGWLTPAQMLFVTNRFDPIIAPLRPPRGTRLTPVRFEHFRAEWVVPRTVQDLAQMRKPAAILYLHGGGLVSCGLNTHRRLVARIAAAAGVPLLNVDYRQIPEAHVTETVEDCITAYRHLLDQGVPSERIIVAGDSAGGGLAFSLALAARDRGLPMPSALVAIAPWADYDATGKQQHPNDHTEAMLRGAVFAMPTQWGIAVDGRLDPRWSPVSHDFAGMPPALIQVGSGEVLLADTELLARRYAEAGAPLTVQIWEDAVHVFQVAADVLPDARDAIAEIGVFMRDALARAAVAESAAWSQKTSA
ncbi:alpha/beta hydrolase [Nocardia yunnanensis]|uniref:Alpha/beta hydrolase n=1 Tax=Nocardia yunnanensis TaxID=2382165 RepID=A0A386ZKM1_9NOCA|nr:alpha/beta hydrolase [Nocardia yunnanensis]AYF77968.1 alpha/beta hydrolase [Nocardia yunnanensis]